MKLVKKISNPLFNFKIIELSNILSLLALNTSFISENEILILVYLPKNKFVSLKYEWKYIS
jgi:hypothetical protein